MSLCYLVCSWTRVFCEIDLYLYVSWNVWQSNPNFQTSIYIYKLNSSIYSCVLTLSHSYIDIVFKLLYLRITDLPKYYIDGKKISTPKMDCHCYYSHYYPFCKQLKLYSHLKQGVKMLLLHNWTWQWERLWRRFKWKRKIQHTRGENLTSKE